MSAEQQEAMEASVRIAHSVRNVHRAVEGFLGTPVTVADLVQVWADPASEWAARLDGLPWDAAREARSALQKLTAIVGEDGQVRDHGWGAGTEQVTVAHIAAEVAGMEAVLAPLTRLRKRKAAA